jgi:hypothetical protein
LLLVGLAGVLHALIDVVNDAVLGLALSQWDFQRRACQCLVRTISHGPADQASRMRAQYGGQVEPALTSRYVFDVDCPDAIRTEADERPLQSIGCSEYALVGAARAQVATTALADDGIGSAELLQTMTATDFAQGTQAAPDALGTELRAVRRVSP